MELIHALYQGSPVGLSQTRFLCGACLLISEWRREKRREASRRSTQRASCYSNMGKQNNIITREMLILAIWFIEQKVIIFRCRINIRDEPARSWRSLTAYFSNMLRNTILKLLQNIATSLKIVVSNSHKDFFISSKCIAFFCEDGFFATLHTYLRIAHEPLNIFEIWLSHVK